MTQGVDIRVTEGVCEMCAASPSVCGECFLDVVQLSVGNLLYSQCTAELQLWQALGHPKERVRWASNNNAASLLRQRGVHNVHPAGTYRLSLR